MEKMTINVYGINDKIVKTCEAKVVDLKFGTIRKLMKLLKIDDIENTSELLKVVYSAWDEITVVLDQCFPDMEDDDWDNVKVNELLPVIVNIAKSAFAEMLTLPTSSKN